MPTIVRRRPVRASDYEEPYYWTARAGLYDGKYPPWFSDDVNTAKAALEANFETIKAEILDFYEHRAHELRPNWLQWGYSTKGWLTLDLYSYGVRKPRNCARFPTLDRIAQGIEGMMLVQVGVLQPHTRIRPHISETAAIVRSHLPIVVPGTLPELGIRVGAETRAWEEGKVFALNIAYRHCAWNLTDEPRIVVVVDNIHPDYADRQYEVAANSLALMAMKGVASSFPALKRAPLWLTDITQAVTAAVFRSLLFVQRHANLALPALVSAYRPRGRRRTV